MMGQAQLLQCPDCGHTHDIAALGDVHTFRCEQCGRALKVPPQFRTAPSVDATVRQPAVARIPDPAPETGAPATELSAADLGANVGVADVGAADLGAASGTATPARAPRPVRMSRRNPTKPYVPMYWRLLVWVAAVPIGLVVVFQLIARKLGWLTQNQLIDAFTAGGWDRFRPIAQLLPLAAFVIALLVQGSVYGIERLYLRRSRTNGTTPTRPRQGAARVTGS